MLDIFSYNLNKSGKTKDFPRWIIWSGLSLSIVIIIGLFSSSIIFANQKIEEKKQLENSPKVLAATDQAPAGLFIVNIPTEFNNDVKIKDKNLDAGNGKIKASNLIYSVTSGTGINITEGQSPQIFNTDPGSNQNIFKSIKVGTQIISAQSNNDTLEFTSSGENGSIAVQDGKIVLKTGTSSVTNNIVNNTNITNTSFSSNLFTYTGLQNISNNVSLQNNNDTLSFGTPIKDGKVNIMSSSNQVGLIVQASPTQSSLLSEWRDANGNPLVTIDTLGNVNFTGSVTNSSFQFTDSTIKYLNQNSNLVLDLSTTEPNNLLSNPNLNIDLTGWSSNNPVIENQAKNPTMQSNINNWNSVVEGNGYSNQFTNPGFETDTSGWQFTTDTVTISQYTVPSANSSPNRPVNAPDGNIWFVEGGKDKVARVTSSGTITEFTVGGELVGITIGADNNIWVTDNLNNQVIQIALNGGVLNRFNMPSGSNLGPITKGGDGNIWLGYIGSREITKLTPSGVSTYYSFPGSFQPISMTLGSDGNVWVTPLNECGVVKVTPAGTITLTNISLCMNESTIISGPDGNLWVQSQFTNQIFKITTGGAMSTINIPNGYSGFLSMTFGQDGKLWMGQWNSNTIHSYIVVSNVLTNDTTYTVTGSTKIGHMTFSNDGNLWFAEPNQNKISAIVLSSPQNRVTTPTHSFSSGALNVNSVSNVNITQNKTLTSAKTYTLTAYVYKESGNTVDSTVAQLYIGTSSIPTTYSYEGSGWYKLTANILGTGISTNYGLKVNSGNNTYIDDLSLNQFAGAYQTFAQHYTSLGSAQVDAPPTASVLFTQTTAFNPGTYSIVFYAYKDGTAVTSSDAQLYYNGNLLSTTISSTVTPGWYQLTASLNASSISTEWGVRVISNRTIYFDDPSLIIGSVNQAVIHSNTSPLYEGLGAVEINSIGLSNVTFFQNQTLSSTDKYVLLAYVYNETPGEVGTSLSSSKMSMMINGSPADTRFSAASDGWYLAYTEQNLAPGNYDVGIIVNNGYKLKADAFAFQLGSGSDRTFSIVNSGSGLAYMDVESTSALNSGAPDKQALILKGVQNQTANLAEFRNQNNDVLSVIDESGRIGIGTSNPSKGLVVIQSANNSSAAGFVNSSTTDNSSSSVIRVSTSTPSGGTATRFITFYAGASDESDGTGVGRIRLNNGGVAYESGGADFAEYFEKENIDFEPGDIVLLNSNGKANKKDGITIGVVSDSAAFVGNASSTDNKNNVLVGLLGQMSIKVTNKNGKISKGDYVSYSDISGYSQKSSQSEMIVGIALDEFTGDEKDNTKCEEYKCGKIKVYVKPQWINTQDNFAGIAKDLITQNTEGNIQIAGGKAVIDKLGNLILASGNLEINKGLIKANNEIRGKAILKKGDETIKVEKSWPNIPSIINATPEYDTNVWITDITKDGFTINVNKKSDLDENINWIAIF